MVVRAFNSRTQESEVGGSMWVQSQPALENKFQDGHGYTVWPYVQSKTSVHLK